MKKFIMMAALMLMTTTSLFAQTANDIFKEFKDKPNVQYISVPKALLGMAVENMDDAEGKALIKKMDSITIMSVENNKTLQKQLEKRLLSLSKKEYEQMVNSNENGEKNQILVRTKGETISEMLIISIEADECAIVQICGKIRPEDVKKLESFGG